MTDSEQPETYSISATVALCRHCQRSIIRVADRWMHNDISGERPDMYWWCRSTNAEPSSAAHVAGPSNPSNWREGETARTAEIPL